MNLGVVLKVLLLVVLLSSNARGDQGSVFADEALAEVDKLLTDSMPDNGEIETYEDCLGATVYVQRASPNCAPGEKRLYVIEPLHSIVAKYCLDAKRDFRYDERLRMYFDPNGQVADGWLLTRKRPNQAYLRHLRCKALGQSKLKK